MLPEFDHAVEIDDRDHRLGFTGAIQAGWQQVLDTGADWCFHVEADFTFNEPVPLSDMIALLERAPHLVQVALKRQAWNDAERAAGGVVEANSEAFTECHDGLTTWTETRAFFTTNPSVYSTDLCWLGWPQVPRSEGVFTHQLLKDPRTRFAYWGGKFDPPRVTHIGEERTGCGY
jgi:hypothetical protein